MGVTSAAVLLAEVDEAFGQLSGPAPEEILRHQHEVFGDERFARLAAISNGHLYTLRGRRAYRRARTTVRGTRGAPSSIGEDGSDYVNHRVAGLLNDLCSANHNRNQVGNRNNKNGFRLARTLARLNRRPHGAAGEGRIRPLSRFALVGTHLRMACMPPVKQITPQVTCAAS